MSELMRVAYGQRRILSIVQRLNIARCNAMVEGFAQIWSCLVAAALSWSIAVLLLQLARPLSASAGPSLTTFMSPVFPVGTHCLGGLFSQLLTSALSYSLPPCLLPPSVPPPLSLPACLLFPPSFLPPFIPPSVSLPPSFPPFLPPSLPPSLPPTLPPSHPPSLPSSLPPCLPACLLFPASLPPSLYMHLQLTVHQ